MILKEIMAREMTSEEAIALAQTEWWKDMDIAEAAKLQLSQDKLCMPFEEFHRGMEELLGRPVWTHEFARPELLTAEIEGKRPAPTSPIESLAELIGEKQIIAVVINDGEGQKC